MIVTYEVFTPCMGLPAELTAQYIILNFVSLLKMMIQQPVVNQVLEGSEIRLGFYTVKIDARVLISISVFVLYSYIITNIRRITNSQYHYLLKNVLVNVTTMLW